MKSSDYKACAIVTGASSGLGEEFAWQLAQRIERLVLVARRGRLLEEVAAKIRSQYPGVEVLVHEADLTRTDECENLIDMLERIGWSAHWLVNNAGLGDYGEFSTSEWWKIEAMLRLNIETLTRLTHLVLPAMIERGFGAVLNVSSLASLVPMPDFAVYAATKAYVTSFSEALRIELKNDGIRVLAVCPGPVHTGFGEVAQRSGNHPKIPGYASFYVPKEQVVAESLAAMEQGRARLYPGLKTAAAALIISALPIVLVRLAMGLRLRKP